MTKPKPMRIDFAAWIAELKREFAANSDMDMDEAAQYVDGGIFDGESCWREMYDEDLSPRDAVAEDMNCWEPE
jgi:hypothetical protein